MVAEKLIISTGPYTKDFSKTIKLMALVFLDLLMAVYNMSVIGIRTSSMVLAKSVGKMAANTKDSTKKVSSMVWVNITGPMVTSISASGKRMS